MLDHEELDIYNVIAFKQGKAWLIRIVSMFTKYSKFVNVYVHEHEHKKIKVKNDGAQWKDLAQKEIAKSIHQVPKLILLRRARISKQN